jgi:hypothetical protein
LDIFALWGYIIFDPAGPLIRIRFPAPENPEIFIHRSFFSVKGNPLG